jgi:hypothetical protein
MSRASFPRSEHSTLLHDKIAEVLRTCAPQIELAERGLDHYRCCYRFGLRQAPERPWSELSIHFQVAERLEANPSGDELEQIIQLFLERNFSE